MELFLFKHVIELPNETIQAWCFCGELLFDNFLCQNWLVWVFFLFLGQFWKITFSWKIFYFIQCQNYLHKVKQHSLLWFFFALFLLPFFTISYLFRKIGKNFNFKSFQNYDFLSRTHKKEWTNSATLKKKKIFA